MQGLCAQKTAIGPESDAIAAVYSRSPIKNSRIVIRRAKFQPPAILLWLNRRHTWAAFSSQRATVFQAIPSTREIPEMLTPSTLRATTVSKVALRCWRR